MVHTFPGTFTVVDGLDGVGKGIVLEAILQALEEKGKRVFSLDHYWRNQRCHPDFDKTCRSDAYVSLNDFDVLLSSEPTYTQIGLAVREEIARKNTGRPYTAAFTAQMFAADRFVLHRRVLLPALAAGKHVLQSRSVSTSLVYQTNQELVSGEDVLRVEDILGFYGNSFCLENGPNLLIIPTIQNVAEVLRRLEAREKKDDAIFEDFAFQFKIKPYYEGEELRKIFEDKGTVVRYLDAGVSIEETQRQAREIYFGFLNL